MLCIEIIILGSIPREELGNTSDLTIIHSTEGDILFFYHDDKPHGLRITEHDSTNNSSSASNTSRDQQSD